MNAARVRKVGTGTSTNKPEDDDLALLEELETGLRIDENALDEALLQQPDLVYRASKQLAILISRRDAAKQEVAVVEAQADLDIRRKAAKRDEKFPEKDIYAQVRLDPQVERAINEHLELTNIAAQFGALKEAFQQRSYVLKSLVDLFIANYFGANSEQGSKNKLRDRDAGSAREGMSAMRRERGAR